MWLLYLQLLQVQNRYGGGFTQSARGSHVARDGKPATRREQSGNCPPKFSKTYLVVRYSKKLHILPLPKISAGFNLARGHGHRKDFFQGWPKVTKFHFTHSILRKRPFWYKFNSKMSNSKFQEGQGPH